MFLRQSTASQEVLLGPFLDDTDGKTAETGLTIANTDIKVWKSGGTTENNKNSGGATHIASGRYYAVLDATDTDTVGLLEINVHVSGALPVRRQLYVLEEAVYDALFAASSAGYSTLTQTQVTGGAYALNSASFAFNSAMGLTTQQKADVNTEADTAATDYGALKPVTAGRTILIDASGYVTYANAAPLDAAGVRSAVGLGAANLDTQLGDIPTVAEFEARTLVAANYGTQANQLTIIGYIDAEIGSIISSLSTIDGKLGPIIDLGGGATIGANLNHLNSVIDTIYTVVDSLGFNGSSMSSIPWNAAWDAEVQSEVADGLAAFWTSPATLVDLIWDEATSGHATAGTTGKALTDALADTNELQTDWANGGRLGLILDAIAANVVLVLDDTGTAGVVLSAATCNKIADHVRRRTQANVEASSDGDALSLLSEYGFIQQAQESSASGSTLTVKRTDGTTTLGTRTLATDAAADPVTGVS